MWCSGSSFIFPPLPHLSHLLYSTNSSPFHAFTSFTLLQRQSHYHVVLFYIFYFFIGPRSTYYHKPSFSCVWTLFSKRIRPPFPLSLKSHFPLLKILLHHHSLCCVYIKEIVLENNLSWGLQEKCIRRVRAGFGARIASFLRKSTKYNWWWSQNDFLYPQDFWWLRLV